MLRLLVAPLALLLLSPLAHAQERDSPRIEGAKALLFQVGPDLTLNSFGGASLAYKRHTSAERAIRVGVTALAEAEAGLGDADGNRQTLNLSASVVPLRYRETGSPVALYTGIGPTATIQYNRSSAGNTTSYGLGVGGGAVGVIGVEWDVADAIGLTAEYGQSLTLQYVDGPDLLRVRFAPTGARLGVSVYF